MINAVGRARTETLPSTVVVGGGSLALSEARSWLARELHDGPVQTLNAMVVQLDELRLACDGVPVDRIALDGLAEQTRDVVRDMRRVLYALRPEPTRLSSLTHWIDTALRAVAGRTGMRAALTRPEHPVRLPAYVTAEVRRIVGEALSNTARHSGAAHLDVTLQLIDDAVAVTVSDDGRGIDAALTPPGVGIRGMRERAGLIGARLTFENAVPHGTVVRLVVPSRPRQ